ncbi:phosphoenolpyruvate-dependent sugar phosphotransferase system eiia, lactose specific [Companilactobacillus crustorum]|uniref:PTS system lactose-specific EIIA component n=4 Tax=Companilactobacillus TaxID=2767879 RepID=A0A837RK37_9LACO|nr:Lactose-specific phosphotransferase enzyme IIA component [Companilactobacillus crustorum]KRK43126.1 phosphoenolpyruvate-dependent sugar phosphotransferase system eiia, lactose specific [Companilactobacillus crustorum JCM 15951]KRO20797.1 phosphoenolpyruvate-dependent sugar phosphotransferase system eiia, lactose specific [Companilactobacillus crustorum]
MIMAVTKEDISMTGFAIVAYAGDAKTAVIKALDKARDGEIEEARKLVKEANQSINDAHNEQTKLLANEAGGMDMDVTFIMVHGQDTLMTTMMLIDQATYFIDQYERINKIENKLN